VRQLVRLRWTYQAHWWGYIYDHSFSDPDVFAFGPNVLLYYVYNTTNKRNTWSKRNLRGVTFHLFSVASKKFVFKIVPLHFTGFYGVTGRLMRARTRNFGAGRFTPQKFWRQIIFRNLRY
jgi:hypothetical protein